MVYLILYVQIITNYEEYFIHCILNNIVRTALNKCRIDLKCSPCSIILNKKEKSRTATIYSKNVFFPVVAMETN